MRSLLSNTSHRSQAPGLRSAVLPIGCIARDCAVCPFREPYSSNICSYPINIQLLNTMVFSNSKSVGSRYCQCGSLESYNLFSSKSKSTSAENRRYPNQGTKSNVHCSRTNGHSGFPISPLSPSFCSQTYEGAAGARTAALVLSLEPRPLRRFPSFFSFPSLRAEDAGGEAARRPVGPLGASLPPYFSAWPRRPPCTLLLQTCCE